MFFASDNWAAAAEPIHSALGEQSGHVEAYGESGIDEKAEEKFREVFERDLSVLFVPTGTAANALALALSMRPGGVAFAHRGAHVIEDECGAPHFAMGGGRIAALDGKDGRVDSDSLARALERFRQPVVHHGVPTAVTITQASEAGTVYGLDHVAAISSLAREAGIPLHMDGARFANALAALGASPAQASWGAGVDMLSLGATKNGCWCAEALVLFDPEMKEKAQYLRKRSGWLLSKSRFIAAQFLAWFEDGLWMDLALHANRMAERLRQAARQSPKARLAWESQANETFLVMERAFAERLRKEGARFYDWEIPGGMNRPPEPDEGLYRLVASFSTEQAEAERFAQLLAS